jgi:hypothetical protein
MTTDFMDDDAADGHIARLLSERKQLFAACKEYRLNQDRLEKELAEARQTIEDMATGGHQ